jgi:hypothetical protein
MAGLDQVGGHLYFTFNRLLISHRLGTLQTCIVDTNHSLDELMTTIHDEALADGVSILVANETSHLIKPC